MFLCAILNIYITAILLKWQKAVKLCRENVEHFFFLISDVILKKNILFDTWSVVISVYVLLITALSFH